MNSADEIKLLRAKVERLNDEADYLATVLALITCRSDSFTPQEAATLLNMVKKDYGCTSVRDWRNAARLTVTKLHGASCWLVLVKFLLSLGLILPGRDIFTCPKCSHIAEVKVYKGRNNITLGVQKDKNDPDD